MITNAIVLGSIILAVLYFLTWLIRSDFREQIERPKHHFQDRVKAYDQGVFEQENGK
ncbi:MAG: hypothetical protein ACO4AC_10675 [Pseudohongiellaceae bacterium]